MTNDLDKVVECIMNNNQLTNGERVNLSMYIISELKDCKKQECQLCKKSYPDTTFPPCDGDNLCQKCYQQIEQLTNEKNEISTKCQKLTDKCINYQIEIKQLEGELENCNKNARISVNGLYALKDNIEVQRDRLLEENKNLKTLVSEIEKAGDIKTVMKILQKHKEKK